VVAGEPVQDKALPTTDEMRKIAYGWTNGTEDPSLKDLWNQDPANKDPDPRKHHTQSIHFDLDSNSEDAHFSINNKAYDPINGPVRKLVLDRIDEWDLVTDNTGPSPRGPFVSPPGAHIFHIHTNPFLVVRRGPNDEDETVWKDSIVVPKGQPVTVYTQYKRFTGEFVIHCHLLDHEDNGMMQAVEVAKETR